MNVCASAGDVLVLGIANLVADGISMGFGDFVSSSTERDVAVKERSVTEWDVENHGTTQKQELIQRYQLLGMNATDAALVRIFISDKQIMKVVIN